MTEDESPEMNEKAGTEEKSWNYSQQISRFEESQVVVGVVRNPRNLMWHTWVSLYGNDVTCLTAHHSRQIAEKTIQNFSKAYEAGKLLDSKAVSQYIKRMPTDKMPGALPEATLREIEHKITNLFFGLRK